MWVNQLKQELDLSNTSCRHSRPSGAPVTHSKPVRYNIPGQLTYPSTLSCLDPFTHCIYSLNVCMIDSATHIKLNAIIPGMVEYSVVSQFL